jgi:hypothetical protein
MVFIGPRRCLRRRKLGAQISLAPPDGSPGALHKDGLEPFVVCVGVKFKSRQIREGEVRRLSEEG